MPMRPEARAFHRAADIAFAHATAHLVDEPSPSNASQVVLSLDHGIEMLLKAAILNTGGSIMERPGKSITLPTALERVAPLPSASSAEVLREYRNSLQHFASVVDPATVADLFEGAAALAREVVETRGLDPIAALAGIRGPSSDLGDRARLLSESVNVQRDATARDDVVLWAEGELGTSALATIFGKRTEGRLVHRRLTPNGGFEYMPRTDGRTAVAYRQSGGIVRYKLESAERDIISDTGGPTDVLGDYVAAQGIGIEGGLGGGVWLYNQDSQDWDRVSDGGDSGRLSEGHLVWQELTSGILTVRQRPVAGGDVQDVIPAGTNPAVSWPWIAWSEWPRRRPTLHVTHAIAGDHHELGVGIFPDIDDSRVAFLRPTGESHDLLVIDIERGRTLTHIPDVGFPLGGGPVITGHTVIFESTAGRNTHALWVATT